MTQQYKIIKEGPKGREWQIYDMFHGWTVNQGYASKDEAEIDLMLMLEESEKKKD